MKQPGFMIYAEDWACYTEDYSDEELGRMLRALLGYFDAQEEPTFDGRGMRQFFKLASRSIDLDRKRYQDKCLQNAYIRYRGICKQQHEKAMSFEEWAEAEESRRQMAPVVTDDHQSSPVAASGYQSSPVAADDHRTSNNVEQRQASPNNVEQRQTTPNNVDERQRTSTNVDERQRTSTNVDERQRTSPTIIPAFNDQPPTVNGQQPTVSNQKQIIKNKKSVFSPNAGREPRFEDEPYRPLSEDEFEKRREQMLASLRNIDRRFL